MGYGYSCKCIDCGYMLVAYQGASKGQTKLERDMECKVFMCEECGYYEVHTEEEQHCCVRCQGQLHLIDRFDENLFEGKIACPSCHGHLVAEEILQEREWLKQSRFRMDSRKITATSKDVKGSYITFGHYPQGPNGEIKPIVWQVLKTEQDKLLVISKYGLDNSCFHDVEEETTWEQSYIRGWLNRDFYNTAFTKTQQQQILVTNNVVEGDKEFRDSHVVQDNIFLLSLNEAREILGYTSYKRNNAYVDIEECEPTDYVVRFRKALVKEGNICWWLRSNGAINTRATYVELDYPDSSGADFYEELGVRPAMWVNLQV